MNTFLVNSNKNELNINNQFSTNNEIVKVWGIALKLSKFNDDFDLIEILDQTPVNIIIDAEDQRLDFWLIKQIMKNKRIITQLNRVYITIQARRQDAEDQIKQLLNYNCHFILVAGHTAYEGVSKIKVNYKMTELITKYENIKIVGANGNRLNQLKSRLTYIQDDMRWLELFGYHQKCEKHYLDNNDNNKKLLWVYTALDKDSLGYSNEALNYLNRRNPKIKNKDETYIVSKYQNLQILSNNFKLVLYFDFLNFDHFMSQLSRIK